MTDTTRDLIQRLADALAECQLGGAPPEDTADAEMSKEERMIDAYKDGRDLHTETAALIAKVPLEEVTKSMRTSAKLCNFGLLYGASPATLINEARAFLAQPEPEGVEDRPKPQSLKEESLELIDMIQACREPWLVEELCIVRRALEALPDD